MTDTLNLEPCPNCSAFANIYKTNHHAMVACSECWVQTGDCETDKEAVREWNTRAEVKQGEISGNADTLKHLEEVFQDLRDTLRNKTWMDGEQFTVLMDVQNRIYDRMQSIKKLPKRESGELERARLALTPSSVTKAALMGEFYVPWVERDENGEEFMRKINVPWTTIKEIMAAIRKMALSDIEVQEGK